MMVFHYLGTNYSISLSFFTILKSFNFYNCRFISSISLKEGKGKKYKNWEKTYIRLLQTTATHAAKHASICRWAVLHTITIQILFEYTEDVQLLLNRLPSAVSSGAKIPKRNQKPPNESNWYNHSHTGIAQHLLWTGACRKMVQMEERKKKKKFPATSALPNTRQDRDKSVRQEICQQEKQK